MNGQIISDKMLLDKSEVAFEGNKKYSILQIGCTLVHFVLIFIFALCQIHQLMVFNIFSTICYMLCGILVKKSMLVKLYRIMFIEICLHSIVATLFVGWESGFPLYIIGVMPVIFYMHFSLNDDSTMKDIILIGISCLLILFACKIISYNHPPIYELSSFSELIIYLFNAFCVFIMLLLFSVIFLLEVRSHRNQLEKENAKLDIIAGTDALTELYNRRSMNIFLQEATENDTQFSIIMCDIDDFKKTNDTYGHKSGDAVLKNVSMLITSILPENYCVCRWGGEEILILARKASINYAYIAAERIRSTIANNPTVVDKNSINVTITIGVAENSERSSIEEIIALADSRLYLGKRTGKNRVVISD